MKLDAAVIAVTGGASGLGAATAQLCTEKGAKVAVLDMNKAPGAQNQGLGMALGWGLWDVFGGFMGFNHHQHNMFF